MMEIQQEHLLVRRQAQPQNPPQGSLTQVNRAARFCCQALLLHGFPLLDRSCLSNQYSTMA
jgi:hypothetical protein